MLRKEPWSEVGLALKHQGKVMVKTMKKDGTSSMGLKKYVFFARSYYFSIFMEDLRVKIMSWNRYY